MVTKKAKQTFLPRDLSWKRTWPRRSAPRIQSSAQLALAFQRLDCLDREVMIVGTLDCKSRLICCSLLALGSSDLIVVRISDAFTDAIKFGGSAIFLVHNHPSGSIKPSNEDITMTLQVAAAGEILGISLVDHVIVGNGKSTSILKTSLLSKFSTVTTPRAMVAAEACTRIAWQCENCQRLNLNYKSHSYWADCAARRCQACSSISLLRLRSKK